MVTTDLSGRSLAVVVLFTVAIGIACNIVGNVTMQAIEQTQRVDGDACKKQWRHNGKGVWIAILIQVAVAFGLIVVAIAVV